jgi:hypothetical protein
MHPVKPSQLASEKAGKGTYDCDLATKLVLDLALLDGIGRLILDDLE